MDLGPGAYAAIGAFDGLHRGHQAVVRTMLRAARSVRAPAVVITFRPHPMTVLRPDNAPLALTTRDQRTRLLRAEGVDAVVELPFTPALAAVSAQSFVVEVLCGQGHIRHAFVGADFSFGAGGAGTPDLLVQWGHTAQLDVTVVPLLHLNHQPISSTRIRQALREGRVSMARRMLGRPYSLEGMVVHGDLRGRELGFPTANIIPAEHVALPLDGVYAVMARVKMDRDKFGRALPGIANLGIRPTFSGETRRLETHIFEFDDVLYGESLEVAFMRRIRSERRFPNTEALRVQMARDVRRARRLLGQY